MYRYVIIVAQTPPSADSLREATILNEDGGNNSRFFSGVIHVGQPPVAALFILDPRSVEMTAKG